MDKTKKEAQNYETLGENVKPIRYVLNFKPNFKTFKYDATEIIEVSVRQNTKEISLNADEIKVMDAGVVSNNWKQKASVKIDKKKQRIILKFSKPVKGNVQIQIKFTGINNDKMYGFYRSKYMHGKTEKYILSSQFEAANARNAFPCFDEPSFKAVFDVSFTVDKEFECISNMPIKGTKNIDKKKKIVQFNETPIMSTYLLYLGVGNYDYVEGKTGKTKVRVVTVPGHKDLAKLPLKYAIDAIKFFEKYFGITYPLPKVDLLAIPDFAAGAMENWGAITFREVALLADEKTSLAGKQRIAEIIAHELAHQWFGDLVTMKWWNDLWLNESFATFMASKANDAVFPEWNLKIEYLRDTIATAFGADQLKSTHPISVAVRSPTDIDQLFDEISYEKGGTVLNMIEHYAGQEVFREGLHIYLKNNSYSNATTYDLWRAIDASAKKRGKKVDAYGVAGYWIDNPGYPLVEVQRSEKGVDLKQNRYFLLKDLSDKQVWPIPINYSVSGKADTMLFDKRSDSIKIKEDDWIKLNYGQNGLYRVRYDKKDLRMLGDLIVSGRLGPADLWGIEHDVFAMARSGRGKVDDYVDFVNDYCIGAKYPLNASVLGHLSGLNDMLYYYNNAGIKRLTLKYSNELVSKLGWSPKKNEEAHDTLLRPGAIARSALLGDKDTTEKAVEMFYSFIRGGKEIDPNLRGAVYTIAAWSEGEKILDLLKERYEKEKLPDEKIRFLRALSMFSDKKLLMDSLEFSMSKKVRLQDSYIIPAIISGNPIGKPIMLDWTEKNWGSLNKIYASGTHMISRYVDNLAAIDTKNGKAEVVRFFGKKENKREDIKNALANTVEMIEANIRFVEANGSG